MAGELRIGGSTASVRLQGSDTIASDQAFTFPDAGAEIVVTPGTADIETTGNVQSGGVRAINSAAGSKQNAFVQIASSATQGLQFNDDGDVNLQLGWDGSVARLWLV